MILTLILAVVAAGAQTDQETRRIPEDSVELTVTGCLNGRILSTIEPREADVQRGPQVGKRLFRLSAKREVMDEVKKRNRQLVDVVGVVKRSALDDKGVSAGPVSITGGPPVAGGGMRPPAGVDNVPVMDVTSVRVRETACPDPGDDR